MTDHINPSFPTPIPHHPDAFPDLPLPIHDPDEDDEEINECDDDDEDKEIEDDDDDGEASSTTGCLRFYVDLKDQGPIISWTALCTSLEDDDHVSAGEDNPDQMDVDEENMSQRSYYDVDDPFIDDSELFDVERSKRIETEMKGFFVQTGDIAVVEKQQKPKSLKSKTSKPRIRPVLSAVDEVANKTKVVVSGQVDSELSDDLAALGGLIEVNHDKLIDSDKKSLPTSIETALMNFESKLRQIRCSDKKQIYIQLGTLFPTGSFLSRGNLKDKLNKMYTQWLPKKHEMNAKKVLRRLKLKIRKDVATYSAAVSAGDATAQSATKKADGTFKYRCRWELFAPDLLELSSLAHEWTSTFNTAQQKSIPKAKSQDSSVSKIDPIQEDVVRRRYFKQVLECWPSECGVASIHLNDAYKRYKIKNESKADAQPALGKGVPTTQGTNAPEAQGLGVSEAQGTSSPASQGTGAPAAQVIGASVAQGTAAPAAQGTAAPGAPGTGAPAAQSTGAPVAQGTVSPAAQAIDVPAAQGTGARSTGASEAQGPAPRTASFIPGGASMSDLQPAHHPSFFTQALGPASEDVVVPAIPLEPLESYSTPMTLDPDTSSDHLPTSGILFDSPPHDSPFADCLRKTHPGLLQANIISMPLEAHQQRIDVISID